jgi:hypothetical protein
MSPRAVQVREEPRDARQASRDGAAGDTLSLRVLVNAGQHLCSAAAGVPGRDERQHVHRTDRLRPLGHDREKHLQVVPRREHRVRSAPAREELQVVINQRHPEPHDQLTTRPVQADQTRHQNGHLNPSSPIGS